MLATLTASDVMLVAIAFVWLAAACFTDIKKREVPNWLSFSLIAIALAVRGVASTLSQQPWYFFSALCALAIFFVVVNALYYSRIFGGGDAKLLLALSAVFATTPVFVKTKVPEPFMLSFTINIFVFGFIYGIVFALYFSLKHKSSFSLEFKKINQRTKTATGAFLACAMAALAFSFVTSFKVLFLLLFALFLIVPFLYVFIKAVEKVCLIKKLSPCQLSEGDWLLSSIKVKNKIIKPSIHGLSSQDIELLKKAKKKVLIKIGLPFVPIFLVALACSLLFGDLLMKVVLSLV